jgi:hypothetical protein
MSLSRAFTTRKAKVPEMGDSPPPHRSNSARDRHHGPILRHKISGPIQLVHTTNMLSYNAPDIPSPHASLRNKSSLRSVGEDSEAPSITESTPPTSPEVSPMEDGPGPVPNHLSTYFSVSTKPHVMPPTVPKVNEAPAIPQRSPSHTKQNSYDNIARQRSVSQRSRDSENSVSTKASYTFSRSSSTSTRASSASYVSAGHNQKAPPVPIPAVPAAAPVPPPSFQQRALKDSHPFGHELAQVTELAEEYSARPLSKEGLNQFSAEDYLGDVQNLLFSFFPEVSHAKPTTPQWI